MDNTTLDSLEEFIDSQYSNIQVSTPKPVANASPEKENQLSQTVLQTVPNNNNNNEGISRNDHEDAVGRIPPDTSDEIQSTPNALLSLMRRTMQGSSKLKKRKYDGSPLKASQTLSEDQILIAEEVFGSLVGIMSDYLTDFKDKLSHQMEVALQRHRDEVDAAMNMQAKEVELLNEELKASREQCVIMEGRLTRAEKEVEDMREKLLHHEARSMRDNLIFHNIPEEKDEDTEAVLKKFCKEELKIGSSTMERIKFDRVHRAGLKARGKDRIIVAKFNPSRGKDVVLQHAKNLDRNKKFGINEQLPRELEERKKRLLPKFREARSNQRNPKWSLDKLIIDNKTTRVERDKIRDINTNTTEVASSMKIKSAPPMNHNKTSYQGHTTSISSQDDIVPALHAMYADCRVARATHNTYAYRLQSGGHVTEHYEDDGDYGAGRHLLNLLKEKDITNRIVCVSSWSGGTYLGRARYEHLVDSARLVLETD